MRDAVYGALRGISGGVLGSASGGGFGGGLGGALRQEMAVELRGVWRGEGQQSSVSGCWMMVSMSSEAMVSGLIPVLRRF